MYVCIKKAMYGCLNSAPIVYEKMVRDLESHIFR